MSTINVKAFGAKGDGQTDDTGALGNAALKAQVGDTLFCPRGTYVVGNVEIPIGVSVAGASRHLTTIKRRHPREGDTPEYLKWLQTFRVDYGGTGLSPVTAFRDLTIDGNAGQQGPYTNYELQQAHLIACYGPKESWRPRGDALRVSVERVDLRNGVADGISLSGGIDARITDCTADEVFRGGITARGDRMRIQIASVTARRGDNGPAAVNFETVRNSDIRIDGLDLPNGGLDIMAEHCALTASHVRAAGFSQLKLRGTHAIFEACEFQAIALRFPQEVEFIDSSVGGVNVWWYVQTNPKCHDARLAFRRCRVSGTGIWLSKEEPGNGNWLIAEDCDFPGMAVTLERGGNVYLRGGRIGGDTSLWLDGFKSSQWRRHYNVILDGVDMAGKPSIVKARPENELEYRNMENER